MGTVNDRSRHLLGGENKVRRSRGLAKANSIQVLDTSKVLLLYHCRLQVILLFESWLSMNILGFYTFSEHCRHTTNLRRQRTDTSGTSIQY